MENKSYGPAQLAEQLASDAPAFAQVFVLRGLRCEQNGDFFEALENYSIARPLTWKYRALIDERIAGLSNRTLLRTG